MRWKKYTLPIIACAICTGAGFYLGFLTPWQPACNKYPLLESAYACGEQHIYISKAGYVEMDNDLAAYIQEAESKGQVTNAAVFFRDLKDGPTAGINEDVPYIPASLLKLPIILALFSIDEQQPGFLQNKLVYATSSITHIQVPASIDMPVVPPLVAGQSYSLEQLMQNTIISSDNLAYYLLIDYINSTPSTAAQVESSLQQLGIVDPRTLEQQTLTTQEYAGLFRLLYNVSYLNAQDSQTVLSWLLQSTFQNGLRAGVPVGTEVAEKWGLRNGTSTIELHDCGIVYYPNNPYTLCVMTSGTNAQDLEQFIATVSQTVYKEVNSRRLN